MRHVGKQTMNVYVDERVAAEFRKVAKVYYNRLGHCMTASMLMFLEADPQTQGDFIKRVFDSEVSGEVEQMLQAIKQEQARRVKARESTEKGKQR
jgi:hypothetical protein